MQVDTRMVVALAAVAEESVDEVVACAVSEGRKTADGVYDGSELDLTRFPRRVYTNGVTALEPLPRVSRWNDLAAYGVNIWIKRDDQLGLVMGGNKTRKLEFAMADALKAGADCVVTAGAVQSNHARLTLAACNVEQLDCYIVLEERVPGSFHSDASGNYYLYRLLGAKNIVVVGTGEAAATMQTLKHELVAQGRSPYIIPGGASDEIGAKGYVRAAQELREQMNALSDTIQFDAVVCASGSAGTHAGMVLGMRGSGVPVIGVSTRFDEAKQQNAVLTLSNKLAHACGAQPVSPSEVQVVDKYVGPGYSLPTRESTQAIEVLARTQGILLDPVYTGKAFAGLLGLIREGHFRPGTNVVFLHTGGSPALFEYQPLTE
ncbi:D-cysteine desulfhydrase [Porphyridium purpureum]|uniref:D-cysteine desulfhydrase n=1 Tax=Porphyridium purpureum TaxID=35688 RepID=A0A5J4YLC5_PORPP|nr:D-cysteine desulfhydrase [Porphyridium purpureum]|eukprot:POR8765..scf249_10